MQRSWTKPLTTSVSWQILPAGFVEFPALTRFFWVLTHGCLPQCVSSHLWVASLTIHIRGDYGYDFFGFKTLEKSYLLRVHGKSVERPQHLLMRAACGIHCGDLKATLETYDLMSRKFFTHATPTLFNSGTPKPQMSSCFLLKMKEDSIEGIYDTLKQCALISKSVLWQTLGTFWERYKDLT